MMINDDNGEKPKRPSYSNGADGVTYSKGRVYRYGSKFKPPEPSTDLEKAMADCMAVVNRMGEVERQMSGRLDALNSKRTYWLTSEANLTLSIFDCFWHRSGNMLMLTHKLSAQEGIPSLSTTIAPDQVSTADEIIKHHNPITTLKDAAFKAAVTLSSPANSKGTNNINENLGDN